MLHISLNLYICCIRVDVKRVMLKLKTVVDYTILNEIYGVILNLCELVKLNFKFRIYRHNDKHWK